MKPKYFGSAAAWRRWLSVNHDEESEAVLLFYKRRLNKGMTYEEALQEALCWGWIDGRLNRIDDRKHVIRFSPRRKGSVWSDANKARVKKLIAEGRMKPSGFAVLPASLEPEGRGVSVPADLRRVFRDEPGVKKFFDSLTQNQRWMYVGWLVGAKMAETRGRRLRELVCRLRNGKKPGDLFASESLRKDPACFKLREKKEK